MQTQNICPVCGRPFHQSGKLARLVDAYGVWRAKRSTIFQNTALVPWQPAEAQPSSGGYTEASRITPVRSQNLESDFLTPLAQALGTGVFVSVAAGIFAWSTPGLTWIFGVRMGVIAAGIHWVLAIIANPANLRVVETIIRSDLNSDKSSGQSERLELEVVHRSTDDSFRQMFRFDLPVGLSKVSFTDFARGVIDEGRGLAESSWTGSGKPFSKPKYNDLLETLMKAGLVRWRNPDAPAQGRELTPAGGRALRSWIEIARTHPQASNQANDNENGYEFIEGVG